TISASVAEGVIGFMNAALGLRPEDFFVVFLAALRFCLLPAWGCYRSRARDPGRGEYQTCDTKNSPIWAFFIGESLGRPHAVPDYRRERLHGRSSRERALSPRRHRALPRARRLRRDLIEGIPRRARRRRRDETR